MITIKRCLTIQNLTGKKNIKSTSDGCKKIDTLFKHVIISSKPDTSGKLLPSPKHVKNEENKIGDSHLTESRSASDNQSPACSDDNKDDSENDSEDDKSEFFSNAR